MTMFSSKFNSAVCFVLSQEGGYSNHPNDYGGETNYGISKRFITANNLKISSIKDLTLSQAKIIYYNYFWLPVKAEDINDDRIALMVFDTAVLCGTARAIDFLQQSITVFTPITVDGIIGQQTLNAINKITESDYLKSYIIDIFATIRKKYHIDKIRENSSQSVFIKGWLNRVNELLKYVPPKTS